MDNPILNFVLALVDEGLHPTTVAVERTNGGWQCRVELDDWCALGDAGDDGPYSINVDRDKLPDGVSVRAKEKFPARTMPLEIPTREDIAKFVAEVQEIGKAPDWAWRGDKCLTRPIEWLREPLRTALLKKGGAK